MAVKEPEVPKAEEPAVELASGWHVVASDGKSLGCYLTEADAEAFANGHPRADGIEVSIVEVV